MAIQTRYVNVADSGGSVGEINLIPDKFYYSLIYLKKTLTSVETLVNSLNSLGIDSKLVNELGYDFLAVKEAGTNTYNDIGNLLRRMESTKTQLEKMDSNNKTLFESIDTQLDFAELMNFGDMSSETDIQLYWEYLKKIYYGTEGKSKSELSEIEKYVIEVYKESGYATYDKYIELQKEIEVLQKEFDSANVDYMTWCYTSAYSFGKDDNGVVVKYQEALMALNEAKAASKELEPELKEKGLMEYTGWEQIGFAFNKGNEQRKSLWNNILSGNFDEAWSDAKALVTADIATGAIVSEKIGAGVTKVSEWIDDGAAMVATGIITPFVALGDSIFDTNSVNKMWDSTMAFVARDRVGEAEDILFKNTSVGRWINDNSRLSYDSAGANLIKNVTVKAVEIVGAAAITIGTGGAAAPFVAAGVGFLEGFGQGSEHQFNIVDEEGNYTNRNIKGVGLAALKGVGKAAEWYGYGQMGQAAVQGIQTISALGKDGLVQAGKSITGAEAREYLKTNLGNIAKSAGKRMLTDVDTWMDAGSGVVNFITSGVESGEYNWGELALDVGLSFVGNYIGAFAGEYAENAIQNIGKVKENDIVLATDSDNVKATPKLDIDNDPTLGGIVLDYDATLPLGHYEGPTLPLDHMATPKLNIDNDPTWGGIVVDYDATLPLGHYEGPTLPLDHMATPKLDPDNVSPKELFDQSATLPLGHYEGPTLPLDHMATPKLDPNNVSPKELFDQSATLPLGHYEGPTLPLDHMATPKLDPNNVSPKELFDQSATLPPGHYEGPTLPLDHMATPKIDTLDIKNHKLIVDEYGNLQVVTTPLDNLAISTVSPDKLDTSSVGAKSTKIVQTNVDKAFAYDEFFEGLDLSEMPKYGATNIPKEMVMDDISEILTYDGDTAAEKLASIRKKFGAGSPQAITAESTLMQFKIDNYDISVSGSNLYSYMSSQGLSNKNQFVNSYVREMMTEIGCDDFVLLDTVEMARSHFATDLDYWNAEKISSSDYYNAMRYYTGSYFNKMNPFMREIPGATLDDTLKKAVTDLSDSLDGFELEKDTIIFRGVDNLDFTLKQYGLDTSGTQVEKIARLSGGVMTISDNAFLSATPVMGEGFTYKKVVEVILAPAGTKGSFIDTFSTCPSEVEFLFQAGVGNKQVIQSVKEIGEQVFVFTKLVL